MILKNISLQQYNTFGIEVKAKSLSSFTTTKELKNILLSNDHKGTPKLILGEGSNILFTKDFDGLVLKNKIISSTLIRNLLSNGKLEYANQLLARKWSIESKVQKGRQMGKEIGFPTCNMDIKDYVIPKLGVYAVRIHQRNNRKVLKGIANMGYRPTFNQKKLLLEVYIFNFSDNLYNKYLTIEFINFIRKEKKFKNINQLKKQINSDLKLVKKKLN